VTPTLSVDAFQDRSMLLDVVPATFRPPGTLGGVLSPPPPPPPPPLPLHAAPLSLQLAGAPPPLATKPNVTEVFAATSRLYSRFVAT